jgi:apolipoprotein D and lipocalin family protein
MSKYFIFFIAAVALTLPILVYSGQKKLQPVTNFNLSKYAGRWYEIARLPASFEKDLTNVTATYSLNRDGSIRVENKGFKKDKFKKAIGRAKFAKSTTTGHLKVSFFGPFYADYIILELDTNEYKYAMVASSLKYLWILNREPVMDNKILSSLIDKARDYGFDTSKLIFTPQEMNIKNKNNN